MKAFNLKEVSQMCVKFLQRYQVYICCGYIVLITIFKYSFFIKILKVLKTWCTVHLKRTLYIIKSILHLP